MEKAKSMIKLINIIPRYQGLNNYIAKRGKGGKVVCPPGTQSKLHADKRADIPGSTVFFRTDSVTHFSLTSFVFVVTGMLAVPTYVRYMLKKQSGQYN